MSIKLKILIIRFSSIGDIMLTTPIIRCVRNQLKADVDFLTKYKYKELLSNNENIKNLILYDSNYSDTIKELRKNKYDLIIDLQNNLRSLKFRKSISVKSYVNSKNIFKRLFLICLGVDLLKNHVVDRYFNSIKKLNVRNDNKGLDYSICKNTSVNFNFKNKFISWSLSGTYEGKKLSFEQIKLVLKKLDETVVLLGGHTECEMANQITSYFSSKKIYNFCGKNTINQSALLIKKSKLLLTNDTGMMHIATAFNVPIISFWGCTKPSLGFYPYKPKNRVKNLISKNSIKPCSKHGENCNFQQSGCIKTISSESILNSVKELLK